MENIEKLNVFRAEVMAEKKKLESGEKPEAHFMDWHGVVFNPEELTEDDCIIWEKLKNGSLDGKDFFAYREKLETEVPADDNSRKMFLAYVANKMQVIFLKRGK